jgi:hypothetical protein
MFWFCLFHLVVDELLDHPDLPVLAGVLDVVGSGNNLKKMQ